MSEIIVKQLAAIVGTPVEVMLKQLQDAGIPVESPEDSITDEQKLKLLEHIRETQQKTSTSNKPKLSVGRRTSERKVTTGAHGRTAVNVEVRRKKRPVRRTPTPATGEQQPAPSVETNRAEELARKLAEERQTLESVRREAAESQAAASEQKEPAVEPLIEEPSPAETTAATDTVEVVSGEEVVQDTLEKTEASESEAATETVVEEPSKQTDNLNFFEAARRHKETAANKAKEEAASLLKKRPSRKSKALPASAEKDTSPGAAEPSGAKTKKKKPFQGRSKPDSQLHIDKGVSRRRKKDKGRQQPVRIERETKHAFEKPTAPIVREVEIPETIVLSELAKRLSVQATEIIKQLMKMGVMATINQTLDQDTAVLVTEELGHTAIPTTTEEKDEAILASVIDDTGEYEEQSRPPVVTIMGHVDHGKTSLLDYIRETRVAAGEAGGITQHIGAYHVETPNGIVTFLDTPGHAAFTAMRARGAKTTDVVIVVVAADDSVMPQTREAIEHTRAAGVPMIVAINKIDKENADPERVKSDLSGLEVIPEEWGGDDVFVEVSAHTGQGIDALLDAILLVSEMQELKAAVDGPAKGVVIEASVEKGRGAVATVLVQQGTLNQGDMVLCGHEYGRVRAMIDDTGKPTDSAGPSIPVSILGLSGAPSAGSEMLVVSNERKAREIAELRRDKERESRLTSQQAAKLEALFSNMGSDSESHQVNLIIKADVHGSVEALKESLTKLSTDEVKVNVVSSGVGGINEGDVTLAQASNAIMIAFNVRADATAKRAASESGVEIRYYSIIYEAIDDVKSAMSGLLSPELREEFVGLAEVKDVFRSSAMGAVAGCLVVEGVVKKGLPVRVLRDSVVIYEGELESLRRHKDDVNEVRTGTECGIAIRDYNDVKSGDQIECYQRTEVARTID